MDDTISERKRSAATTSRKSIAESAAATSRKSIADIEASPPASPQITHLFAIDAAAEKLLLRKCDIRVIPILGWMYLLLFMDRLNIGNARIQGMFAHIYPFLIELT
jgi:hypothetical protein